MKQLILFSLLFFLSCSVSVETQEEQSSMLNVVLDYTEGQNYDIHLEDILSNTKNVEVIKVHLIRDLSFSETKTISITWDKTMGNKLTQKGLLKKARVKANDKFNKIVSDMNSTYSGKELPKSNIVRPLSDIIDNAHDGDYIYIFSDMLEFTKNVNFRHSNKEKTMQYLSDNLPSKDVNIVAIIATDRSSDDEIMREVVGYWKDFFDQTDVTFSYRTSIL